MLVCCLYIEKVPKSAGKRPTNRDTFLSLSTFFQSFNHEHIPSLLRLHSWDMTSCVRRKLWSIWDIQAQCGSESSEERTQDCLRKWLKQSWTSAVFKTDCQICTEQQAFACCSKTRIFSWGFVDTKISFMGTSNKLLRAYRLSTDGRVLPYCHL